MAQADKRRLPWNTDKDVAHLFLFCRTKGQKHSNKNYYAAALFNFLTDDQYKCTHHHIRNHLDFVQNFLGAKELEDVPDKVEDNLLDRSIISKRISDLLDDFTFEKPSVTSTPSRQKASGPMTSPRGSPSKRASFKPPDENSPDEPEAIGASPLLFKKLDVLHQDLMKLNEQEIFLFVFGVAWSDLSRFRTKLFGVLS